jgi:hypothetical protein
MARVLVFTDRDADDADWKGALSWRIILSLAESQHEVMVATPLPTERVPFTHPRLTVTRPLTSWRADQILPLTRAFLTFRPQAVQTFALAPSVRYSALSLWPYLSGMCKMFPNMRRVSTLFDENDCHPGDAGFVWHQQADAVTVFCERHRARIEPRLKRTVHVVPMENTISTGPEPELERDLNPATHVEPLTVLRVLIPAPVSEWNYPESGLALLADFCARYPDHEVQILGGWGDWSPSQRKAGWLTLEKVSARVHLRDAPSLAQFTEALTGAQALWLEPLKQDSWRYLLAAQLGRQMNKHLFTPNSWTPSVTWGSTANSLSRLYLQPGAREHILGS